jgi:hypothetical protein
VRSGATYSCEGASRLPSDDLQNTYRDQLYCRIAIRPHIRAEGSATQRSPV